MALPGKFPIQIFVIVCILKMHLYNAHNLDQSQDVISGNFLLSAVVHSTNPVLSHSTTTILEECVQYCLIQPRCIGISMSADNDCEMFEISPTSGDVVHLTSAQDWTVAVLQGVYEDIHRTLKHFLSPVNTIY